MNQHPPRQLIEDITTGFASTWRKLADLPWADTWDMTTPLPTWTVGDIAGHLIHLERDYVLAESTEVATDLHALTAAGVDAHRQLDRADAISTIARMATESPETVAALEDWTRPRPTVIGPQPTWMALEMRLADLYVHLLDLAESLGIDPDGIRHDITERVVVDRAVRLSGWAAARKAKLENGSVIRLSLSGPGATETEIAVVDGRGVARQPTGFDATDRIEGPGIAYALVAGGRSHPAVIVDALAVTGERASRLLDRFGLFG